jgi:hypothetical protein
MPQIRRASPQLVNATLLIIQAVLSKEIATQVSEPLKSSMIKSADESINFITDEYCGTGVHSKMPSPMPGPRPMGIQLALSVATFAHHGTLSGGLREELMKMAGHLTEKAYA